MIVVGAGFAGLSTALELQDQGFDVKVLEARDRVGGRSRTDTHQGVLIEGGGQFVGPAQRNVLSLLDRFECRTYEAHDDGDWLLNLGGRFGRETTMWPALPGAGKRELLVTLEQIDKLAETVPPEAPWAAEFAPEWDLVTLEGWICANVSDVSVRGFLRVCTEILFAADWSQVSFLHLLLLIKTCGGSEQAIWSAQRLRVEGGTNLLAERMASELDPGVRFGASVLAISVHQGGTVVELAGGEIERGKRVVVAVPPTLAGRIRYSPALPATKDRIFQRMPNGNAVKIVTVYERPFWRDAGLNGLAISTSSAVSWIYDNCWRDPDPGLLVGFSVGAAADHLLCLSDDERRQVVLGSFTGAYGSAAADPDICVEFLWSEEEHSRGCYAGYGPPGFWTQAGMAISDSVGPIHWAGTEVTNEGFSFIDGAIASGRKVAAEVAADLRSCG